MHVVIDVTEDVEKERTDSLVAVVERDALVDVAPVGAGEVGLDAGPRHDVHPVLGVVEGLQHGD